MASYNVFTPAIEAIDEINKKIISVLDVVRKLRYVETEGRKNKKYKNLKNTNAIKKIYYIKKAKTDSEKGILGEKLALEYEFDKLMNMNRKDLAEKV